MLKVLLKYWWSVLGVIVYRTKVERKEEREADATALLCLFIRCVVSRLFCTLPLAMNCIPSFRGPWQLYIQTCTVDNSRVGSAQTQRPGSPVGLGSLFVNIISHVCADCADCADGDACIYKRPEI